MKRLRGIGSVLAVLVLALTFAPTPVRAAPYYLYLSFVLQGEGSATVQTLLNGAPDPAGIDCRMIDGVVGPQEICDGQFDGGDDHLIRVYFQVSVAPGTCIQVSGQCREDGYASFVDLTVDKTITETFHEVLYTVEVSPDGYWLGTIHSTPVGIACDPLCSHEWKYGVALTLVATANTGGYFDHWFGACAGQGATCHLTVTSNIATGAWFLPGSPPQPSASTGTSPGTSPGASPHVTPRASVTATLRPSAPGASPATSLDPSASLDASPGESGPVDSIGAPSPVESMTESASPAAIVPGTVDPAGANQDLMPIVLAILGAGLLIAIAIGFAAFRLTRRPRPGGPPPTA